MVNFVRWKFSEILTVISHVIHRSGAQARAPSLALMIYYCVYYIPNIWIHYWAVSWFLSCKLGISTKMPVDAKFDTMFERSLAIACVSMTSLHVTYDVIEHDMCDVNARKSVTSLYMTYLWRHCPWRHQYLDPFARACVTSLHVTYMTSLHVKCVTSLNMTYLWRHWPWRHQYLDSFLITVLIA